MRDRGRAFISVAASLILLTALTSQLLPAAPAHAVKVSVDADDRLAFDRQTTPSVSSMETWWANSPYYDVGVYLGGLNYAGDNSNFTTGWVNSVIFGALQSWNLMPIWVGRQAPCLSSQYATIDPSTAGAQGQNAADLAASAAQARGINPGATLFLDIEGYDIPGCSNESASKTAVNQYVNGWDLKMDALGYTSGVYGSTQASHAVDWITIINNKPYDIWGAAFQTPINKTVWDLPGIPNAQWNGLEDRRLHQYKNSPSESHGGVGPWNIDINCNVGRVTGPNLPNNDDETSGGQTEDPTC